MTTYVFFFGSCVVAVAIAAYMFVMSMIDDVKDSYKSLSKCTKAERNRPEFIEEFYKTIHFHSLAKQLSSINGQHNRVFLKQFDILSAFF